MDTDKVAGRSACSKVGNMRIPQRTRNASGSQKENTNIPIQQATAESNIGGLGGIKPDLSKAVDDQKNEQEIAINATVNKVFTKDNQKNAYSQGTQPKTEISHKTNQKFNIQQPNKHM